MWSFRPITTLQAHIRGGQERKRLQAMVCASHLQMVGLNTHPRVAPAVTYWASKRTRATTYACYVGCGAGCVGEPVPLTCRDNMHGSASRWKKPYLMRDRGVNLEDVIPVHTTRDCLRPRCELCDDPSAPPRSRTHATLVRSPVVALLCASGCVRNCGWWGGRCATTARPRCATTAGIARTATARDRSCTPSTTSTIASCAACLQLRGRA